MAHKFNALSVKRILAQILQVRSHTLFTLPCRMAAFPPAAEGEFVTVLSRGNLTQHQQLCDDLVSLNGENDEYLKDIARDRLAGVIISADGAIVHYGFLLKENRTRCLLGLPESAALIGNAYTIPSYRGRGYQGRSILARAGLARDTGFSAVFAETSPDNLASQRGMEKAGMRYVGRMDLLIIFRFLVIRWRRPAGFSFFGWCW